MKYFVLRVSILGLSCPFLLPPSSAYAHAPPADSVHFWVPFDFQQWRRDHPRPAAKGLADLNRGEPRTVRIIHLIPNDRPYRAAAVDTIKSVIRQIQTFYSEQMQAHGYGDLSFRFETDGQGEPLVHRLDGQRPDREYTESTVFEEVERAFDLDANLYLIVLDSEPPLRWDDGTTVLGTGVRYGKSGGFAWVPDLVDESISRISWKIAAHELGHAFGLYHDFRDDEYLMAYGVKGPYRLSACSAEFLAVHPYFNPDIPIEEGSPPDVELLSPTAYPADSESVSIRVEVGDAEGVHQVILASVFDIAVKGCRGVAGRKEDVLEFEYDGMHPRITWQNLSDPAAHPIFFGTVDGDGNVHEQQYILTAASPYHVATLEDHIRTTRITYSVAFSPDGTLASGSGDGTVKLWDVGTRELIATLEEHATWVYSVAFSPDGIVLASGSGDGTVKLWDVASRRNTATLAEHSDEVLAVAFSPDGTILASGSYDNTIKLWDVASRRNTATLAEHSDGVLSVAFSPDGTVLASGSYDNTIRLWDVETGERIATLEGHSFSVNSVVFSRDGTILASGSNDNTIKLWDVVSRRNTATLTDCRETVEALAFSPDGATLAAASWDQRMILWDVATGKRIEVFAHTSPVEAIAFSPDGTTLASGAGNGAVTLWNTSEWAKPRPYQVVMISGDGQQGAPGEALDQPLVVEVRDQYGDPVPDAPVIFTATDAEGAKLSGRFTVERAITDDHGRAALTLTLGLAPGATAVEVSLGGWGEGVTFRAVGIGLDITDMEGDYRTWHLPDEARVRLGTGALSDSDRSLAFSPDGQILAVASGIGVWLYDAPTARALALLPFPGANALAFSPDGATLASASWGITKLWDVANREEIFTLGRWDEGGGSSLAFTPDGATLATGKWDGTIRLWDVENRQKIVTLGRHDSQVQSLAFTPDGATLASGSRDDGIIRLWDVENREEIATFQEHIEVESLAFSPDGATLASAGGFIDPTLRLWDVATRAHVATLVSGHVHGPYSISFSPDGATVAAGMSGAIWVWDVAARELINTIETETVLPQANTSIGSVVYSPDGTMLASAGSRSSGVWLWDVGTGRWSGTRLGEHADRIESLAFTPDSALLLGVGARVCRLWDVAAGAIAESIIGIRSFSLSPDGALLALGSHRAIKLWDMETRAEIASLEAPNWVESVSFSADGRLLASAIFRDNTIKLWDVNSRKEVASLQGHSHPVTSVTFSPDGETLASQSWNGFIHRIKLWDVENREEVASLEGHRTVAFSPDSATLAASGSNDDDGRIKLWDVENRQEIATLIGHTYQVESVAFSPDGAVLASGSSWDNTLKLWDVATRAEIASLEGSHVAFSPNGAVLAMSGNGRVKLWDVENHKEIASFQGGSGGVSFSPDGATLASWSDGTVVLRDVEFLLRPPPQTLARLSGDEQKGPAGSELTQPFVVLVRDRNGDPLAGATVTFAVTAGGGTLSAATATTDADGRAAATLILGSEPGRNTVSATVAELDRVTFTATGVTIPQTLSRISGNEQEGASGASLPEPLVASVLDQNGAAYPGATVTFEITSGDGTLSAATDTTDADGRAATTLTLGREPGTVTVVATVAGIEPVTFTATTKASPDFDGDGETGFSDFFLFADAFGSNDSRFDLDGSGSVDFADFFLLADHFEDPARGKLLALARERIGLPDGPQLQQNAPNPFNSQTVISWFQLRPGPARVEVFALTGQRVAMLHHGPSKAGYHPVHWDGRDDRGRPLASGVYLYRLVTTENVQTRKLTLLR